MSEPPVFHCSYCGREVGNFDDLLKHKFKHPRCNNAGLETDRKKCKFAPGPIVQTPTTPIKSASSGVERSAGTSEDVSVKSSRFKIRKVSSTVTSGVFNIQQAAADLSSAVQVNPTGAPIFDATQLMSMFSSFMTSLTIPAGAGVGVAGGVNKDVVPTPNISVESSDHVEEAPPQSDQVSRRYSIKLVRLENDPKLQSYMGQAGVERTATSRAKEMIRALNDEDDEVSSESEDDDPEEENASTLQSNTGVRSVVSIGVNPEVDSEVNVPGVEPKVGVLVSESPAGVDVFSRKKTGVSPSKVNPVNDEKKALSPIKTLGVTSQPATQSNKDPQTSVKYSILKRKAKRVLRSPYLERHMVAIQSTV